MNQEEFKKLFNEGYNIDLGGLAGTGKTYILKECLAETNKKFVVVAPTGIAAINVGGTTIHSSFGIYGNDYSRINKQKIDWNKFDGIIYDEKSMIGPDLLDHTSNILSVMRRNKKPFGGMQVILCGDIAQLPPIYNIGRDKEQIEEFNKLKSKYGNLIYSSSEKYKLGNFKEIFLTDIKRTNDSKLIDIVNRIRSGDLSSLSDIKMGGYTEQEEKDSVHIMHTNVSVDSYNNKQLSLIKSNVYLYTGRLTGKFNKDNVLTPVELYLKKDCRVMLTRNIFNLGLYNGDIGTVVALDDKTVIVNFDRLGEIPITKMTWEQKEYLGDDEVIVGSYSQIPLKLSYAITTHKSQGLSLDKVIIHYTTSMSLNNIYVAVTRAKTYDNLYLAN